MKAKMGDFFKLPKFADEGQTTLARQLYIVLWTILLSLTLAIMLLIFSVPNATLRWLQLLASVNTVCLVLLGLTRLGRTRLASWLLVLGLWIIVTFYARTAGGIRAPITYTYLIIVFVAGLLLGARAGISAGVGCSLTGLALAYAGWAGVLPASTVQHNDFSYWTTFTSSLAVIIGLQYLASSSIKKSINKAQQELAERRHAEMNLHESHEQYRQLFDQMISGLMVCEVICDESGVPYDHRFIQANPAFDNLTGVSMKDQIGKTSEDLAIRWPPEVVQRLYKVAMTGESIQYERFNESLGRFYDTRVFSPRRGQFAHIFTDVTERKRAELAHQDAEYRYRSLSEATFEAIVITDNGVIVDANQQFMQMWGTNMGEVLGQPLTQFVIPGEWEILRQVIAGGKESVREYTGVRKDGSQFYLEAHGRMIEQSRRQLRVTSIRNITERKQAEQDLRDSEERFRKLFEQAPLAIMVSRKGMPIQGNQLLLKMLQLESVEDLISRPVFEYFAPQCQEESKERTLRRNQGLAVPDEIETTFQRKDGTQFPVYASINQINLSDGPANVSFLTDISDRKLAREQLESSLQQLHTLSNHLQTIRENERAAVAREIHDELGQALTGLKMELFWLKAVQPNTEGTGYPGLVEEKLASALKDVDLTIDLVRAISTSLRPSILDTLGLVPALEWLAHDFQARSGLSCSFKSCLKREDFSQEFATAAFRICQESLTNVARHAYASRVNVLLYSGKDQILLEVEDNGCGISEGAVNRSNSLGIMGMKERAYAFTGSVELKNVQTGGTRVIARFSKHAVFHQKN